MNIYQNTQIGGLIHKLSKYQTLLARASPSKANIYASKVNSYKSQLAAIGYGGNQEGGMKFVPSGTGYKDEDDKTPTKDKIYTVNEIVAAATAKNKEFQDGANEVGRKYNNLITQLTAVFAEIAGLQQALKEANERCTRSTAETADERAKNAALERKKAEIAAQLEAAKQKVKELEREIEAARKAADEAVQAAQAAAKRAAEAAAAASVKENARLQAEADRLRGEADQLRQKVDSLEQKLIQTRKQKQELEHELQSIQDKLAESQKAERACQAKLDTAEARIVALTKDLEAAKRQVQTATDQIVTLANVSTSFKMPPLNRIPDAAPEGLTGTMLDIFNAINAQATPPKSSPPP